jgi:hypothetical protein
VLSRLPGGQYKVGERDRLEAIKRLNRLVQDSGEK